MGTQRMFSAQLDRARRDEHFGMYHEGVSNFALGYNYVILVIFRNFEFYTNKERYLGVALRFDSNSEMLK